MHSRNLAGVLGLLLIGAAAAFGVQAAADPVAVVVRASGAVQVERAGKATVAASPGLPLAPGDRVVVPGGAQAVLLYRTGKKETATAPVVIQEPAAAERAGLFSRTVATLNDVAAANARTDPNRQGMIRPVPGTPVGIAPRNDVNVLSTRPTLVWFRVPDAAGYTVMVKPENGKAVRFETGAVDTIWTLPQDAELQPGTRYMWSVSATGGRPAPPVYFVTLDEQRHTAVRQTLDELAEVGLAPDGDGLFLAALAYRDAGLFYEANHSLDRMAERGEGTGRAYHLLRAEVYDALGQLEAANAAFARADAEPAI